MAREQVSWLNACTLHSTYAPHQDMCRRAYVSGHYVNLGVPIALRRLHPGLSYPEPIFSPSQHHPFLSELSVTFMSMSEQAIPSTSSTSNVQLITDALTNYAKMTGVDLAKNPFATSGQSTSPEAILQLLQERKKAFSEYRDGNRRLINALSPAVNIIQAFSGILGDAVCLVSTHTIGGLIELTLSGPFPTSKRFVRRNRYSSSCMFLQYTFQPVPVINEYARLPVESHRAMMPFSSCSSAWGSSLGGWRSIRRSRPLRC